MASSSKLLGTCCYCTRWSLTGLPSLGCAGLPHTIEGQKMSPQLELPNSLSASSMQHCPAAPVSYRAEMQRGQNATGHIVRLMLQCKAGLCRVHEVRHASVYVELSTHYTLDDACLCFMSVACRWLRTLAAQTTKVCLQMLSVFWGLVFIAGGCEGLQLNLPIVVCRIKATHQPGWTLPSSRHSAW